MLPFFYGGSQETITGISVDQPVQWKVGGVFFFVAQCGCSGGLFVVLSTAASVLLWS